MGLPSESEGSSVPRQQDDDDDEDDDDDDEVTDAPGSIPPPAPSVPLMPEVPSLGQSQSMASLASQASSIVNTMMAADEARCAKFEAQFNAATSTNEEVLGEFDFFHLSKCFLIVMSPSRKEWLFTYTCIVSVFYYSTQ